jgi:hypothetical protein
MSLYYAGVNSTPFRKYEYVLQENHSLAVVALNGAARAKQAGLSGPSDTLLYLRTDVLSSHQEPGAPAAFSSRTTICAGTQGSLGIAIQAMM